MSYDMKQYLEEATLFEANLPDNPFHIERNAAKYTPDQVKARYDKFMQRVANRASQLRNFDSNQLIKITSNYIQVTDKTKSPYLYRNTIMRYEFEQEMNQWKKLGIKFGFTCGGIPLEKGK